MTLTVTLDKNKPDSSANRSAKPRSFPNGNGDFSEDRVAFHATAILAAGRKSVTAILEQARLIHAAIAEFGANSETLTTLSSAIGMSKSTLSKFNRIESESEWLIKIADRLPPDYTTIYALACLSDEKREDLLRRNIVRPDMCAADIDDTTEAEAAHEAKSSTLAAIKVPLNIGDEQRAELTRRLYEAISGLPATLKLAEAKRRPIRKRLVELRSALQSVAMEYSSKEPSANASNISREEYELLTNVAWQHHCKAQKKAFPYSPEDPNSIENPKHKYSIRGEHSSQDSFLGYLRGMGITTPFSALSDVTSRVPVLLSRLALSVCDSPSSNKRADALSSLKSVVEGCQDGADRSLGNRYVEMIEEATR